jgi:hypothetical protein
MIADVNSGVPSWGISPFTLPLLRIRTMEFQPTMEPRKAAYHIRLCDRGLISVAGMKMTG